MEMHEIRYFLAVCDTLNFTRAAERCNVSQPSLTRAIKNLEGELGGALFRRERNYTQLTPLGQAMRDQLAPVLAHAQGARAAAHRLLNLEQTPLSVGVMCTIGPQRLVDFLKTFLAARRGIHLNLREAPPQNLVADLMNGRLEVALVASPSPLHERFQTRDLYKERYVIAFPPRHRFKSMNAVPMKALDGESYLDRINCEYFGFLADRMREQDVHVTVPYRSEREDWIQCMIMAGLGVCFMPEYLPTLPGLVTRPVIDPEVVRTVQLVTVAGREHSPGLKAFLKAVTAHDWRG